MEQADAAQPVPPGIPEESFDWCQESWGVQSPQVTALGSGGGEGPQRAPNSFGLLSTAAAVRAEGSLGVPGWVPDVRRSSQSPGCSVCPDVSPWLCPRGSVPMALSPWPCPQLCPHGSVPSCPHGVPLQVAGLFHHASIGNPINIAIVRLILLEHEEVRAGLGWAGLEHPHPCWGTNPGALCGWEGQRCCRAWAGLVCGHTEVPQGSGCSWWFWGV